MGRVGWDKRSAVPPLLEWMSGFDGLVGPRCACPTLLNATFLKWWDRAALVPPYSAAQLFRGRGQHIEEVLQSVLVDR